MNYWLRVSLQITFLWIIYESGNLFIGLTNIPIPGNVLGMVLLFVLLFTGIISISWVEEAADLLLKHLAFFFIPIAVGLMEWVGLFRTSGVQLLMVIVLGAAVCILVTGLVAQVLASKRSAKGGI
ncbi:CidA/LrgA family protein [Desulfosporosinus sp. BG]|uniref:CidA/LrgA family protein n=1 Tax=Desulfosporosinus sp. BG TaxID=1633135 RepID=UPI000839F992|nr:CidA/LrgA family protein [Desulfosporosinus sp. BG]ODA42978.1 Holin-like protein CidA [Desulfosporosinus sp. BG]